jgi:transposase
LRGFVYGKVELRGQEHNRALHVRLCPRKGSKPHCANCGKKGVGYDTLPARSFAFVPLWGIPVFLVYAMRRVNCRGCGVTVEMVPWASGKSHATYALIWFLARWAKVLAWKEAAKRFHTSWDTVFRAVKYAVTWGLAHRVLDGVRSIGVDELAWTKGHRYVTLVYQIDHGCRRLLWIGRDRTKKSFNRFFDMLGDARSKALRFIARMNVSLCALSASAWNHESTVVARIATRAPHALAAA